MRKIVLFVTTLSVFTVLNLSAFGQDQSGKNTGVRQHDGFYLSLGIGPAFGSIRDDLIGDPLELNIKGTGIDMDLKIGYAIAENLILHGTLTGKLLTAPIVKVIGAPSVVAPPTLNVDEFMFGGGLTYYVMPINIFFSGSCGLGWFSIQDDTRSVKDIRTQPGFSMQLKAGKEWWILDNLGLGAAITYSKTILTYASDGESEKLDSNRFGLLLNLTFN